MKLKNTNNILCSVSAGYSSVLMATKIREWYPNHNIVFAMANTSKERYESLDFMDKASRYFNIDLIWVEAVINQEQGKGTGFDTTDYTHLKRNGEIFEQGIKKYGIPSKINKWCNRELKLVPLKKFADEIFGLNNYSIAVGIRADEMDRVMLSYKNNNVFYPLLDNNLGSRDRNKFWKDQPIKLEIEAFEGNCDFCFEKSFRKLMTIAKRRHDLVGWWDEMIQSYSKLPIEGKPSYNAYALNNGMNFFRENKSADDIVKMAKQQFTQATDEYVYETDLFDFEGDCGSGCVVF